VGWRQLRNELVIYISWQIKRTIIKITDLTTVQGGRRRSIGASVVYSNFLNDEGKQDMDTYDQYGNFAGRWWVGDNCDTLTSVNPNW